MITATGRVFCQFQFDGYTDEIFPVEFVKVSLKDKDAIIHDTFGTTQTNSSGYFEVSGSASDLFGNPDPFIEVEYKYTGIYGEMEVENELLGINRREKTKTKTANAYLDFGDLIYDNHHCRSYIQTLRAMRNFHQRTTQSLPYNCLKVITSEIGIPFATVNKIRIPSYFNYTFSTAKHELAHTVRQSLVSLCTSVFFS